MATLTHSRSLLRVKETKSRERKEVVESTTPTMKPAAIPAFPSSYKNTVSLHDWWLCKSEKDYNGKRLAVGGIVALGSAVRVFNSAPIIKRYDAYTLETADSVTVTIWGLINRSRMHQNGFPPEACNLFLMGFPYNWDDYAYNCFGKEFMANSIHTSTSSDDRLPGHSANSSGFSIPIHSEAFTTSRELDLLGPIHGFSVDRDARVSFRNCLRNFTKHVEKTPSKVTPSEIKSCVVGSLDETPSKYEKSKSHPQHENRKDVATSMAHVNVDIRASHNEGARNESTFVSGEAHREKSELNRLKDTANDASHGSSLQTNTKIGSLPEPMTGIQGETISAGIKSTVKANQTVDVPRDKYFMEVSESGDDDASHHSSVQANTGIVGLSEMISEVPKGTLLRCGDPEGDNQTDDIPVEKYLMEGSEKFNTYASAELKSSKSNTEVCKRINMNFSKSESTKSSSTPISKDHVDVNSDEKEPRCYKNVNAENVSISGLVEESVSNKTKKVYLKFSEETRSCNCDAVDNSSLKSSMERPEVIMSGLLKDTLSTCIRDPVKEGQTIDVPGEKSYSRSSEYSKIDASEKLKKSKRSSNWNHVRCRRTTRSFSKSKTSKSSDISVCKDSVGVKHDESEPRCHKNPNAEIVGGVVKAYFSKETYEMHPKTPEAIKSFKFDFGDNSSMQISCTKSPEVSNYDVFCNPSLQLNTKILNLHERTTGMQKETLFTGMVSLDSDESVEKFHIDSSHDLHTNLKIDELPGAMSEMRKKTLCTSARDLLKNQKNDIRGGKSYMGRSENSKTDASEKLKGSTSNSKTNWVDLDCRRITRSLSKIWGLSSSISKDSVGVIHHVGEPQNHENSNACIAGFAGLSTELLSNVTNEENIRKSKHNTVNGPSQESCVRVDEMIRSLSEMGSGILRGTAEQHAATQTRESDVLPMMQPGNNKALSSSGKRKRGRPKNIPHDGAITGITSTVDAVTPCTC